MNKIPNSKALQANSTEPIYLNYLFACYGITYLGQNLDFNPTNTSLNNTSLMNYIRIYIFHNQSIAYCNISIGIWGIFFDSIQFLLSNNLSKIEKFSNSDEYGVFPFILPEIPKNQEEYCISSYRDQVYLNGFPKTNFWDLYMGYNTDAFGTLSAFAINRQNNDQTEFQTFYEKNTLILLSYHHIFIDKSFPFLYLTNLNITSFRGYIELIETNIEFEPFRNTLAYLLIGFLSSIFITSIWIIVKKHKKGIIFKRETKILKDRINPIAQITKKISNNKINTITRITKNKKKKKNSDPRFVKDFKKYNRNF